MTGPTTLTWPAIETIYTADSNGATPVPVANAATGVTPTATLSDFILYLPLTFGGQSAGNASGLVDALALRPTPAPPQFTPPMFTFDAVSGGPSAVNGSNNLTLSSATLFVPITDRIPAAGLDVGALFSTLTAAKDAGFSAVNVTTTMLMGSSSSPAATSKFASPTTNLTQNPAETTDTAPTGTEGSEHTSGDVSTAALAGGVIGALLGGLLLGGILAWLFRRKRSQSTRAPASEGDSSRGSGFEDIPLKEREPRVVAIGSDSTGWQKHLPQDKDDGTITKNLKSVFEQIRTHIEGSYEGDPNQITPTNIRDLEAVSSDGLADVLLQARDAVTLLEAILLRWVIHRISGRSAVDDSLLPPEFAKGAVKNNWHMENDSEEDGTSAEHQRGFSPAFSQWRKLTAFLGANRTTDQVFKKELGIRIDDAAQSLANAFSPWQIPGTSSSNIMQSLRRILHDASDAGVMLFSQSSTYVYDWSDRDATKGRSVVVAPALIKTVDESAQILDPPATLIAARKVKI